MHLTLHLTTGCNMNCKYCYSPPINRRDMSEQIATQAILYGFNTSPHNLGIIFFGGEPLLKKGLIEKSIIFSEKLFKNSNFKPHFKITTNGILLDDSFMRFANSVNMSVALSFDGIQQAHDYHRKTKGGGNTFKLIEDKLKLLLSFQPYASVYMTVSPETVQYYYDSVCYLFNKGIKYLIVSLNYAGKWTKKELTELEKQYKKISQLYERMTKDQEKFYFSPFEIKFASRIKGEMYECDKCHLGMRQISISCDGSIFPCVQFVNRPEYKIGNVIDGVDYKIRNNLHDLSCSNESCNECTLRNRCNNNCSCLNIQTTGMINQVSPILCRTEKMLINIVDRLGERLYKQKSPMFIHKHYNAVYPIISLLEDLN
ncbi:MAG TPA: radical SAM protein [Ignavibacteriaceae bacterium]|nr:radical SAM protein [Ignavibacteriaceae bacterium]HRP93110.1 radical SAM protein [Ignavibacteriaceae bacterium]